MLDRRTFDVIFRRWRSVLLAVLIQTLSIASDASAEVTQPMSVAPVLARVLPSVVSISAKRAASGEVSSSDFNDRPFGSTDDSGISGNDAQSSGSGVIFDGDRGLIVTTRHLIGDHGEIIVTTSEGKSYPATIMGSDAETDIAVVKVPEKSLKSLAFGNSTSLHIGDFVAAIGNPYGIGQTATLGIVSALRRGGVGDLGFQSFIQTDAAINPGNSGGALIDLNGVLVGINTAIMGPSGGNVGIGFAIPAETVRTVANEIVLHGEVKRGQLGVIVQDNNSELASALSVHADWGAVVGDVQQGSPGESAGIAVGDVILAMDNVKIESALQLRTKLASMPPGVVVTLSVARGRDTLSLTATLALLQPEGAPQEPPTIEGTGALALTTLTDIGPESSGFGRVRGAYILSMSDRSRASSAGLTAGDVIVSVNLKPGPDAKSIAKLAAVNSPLLLGVFRDGHSRLVFVK